MKYFTLDWWKACQFDMPTEEMQRPERQYRHYYSTIQEHLPPRFAKFCNDYSLHDAAFRSLELDVSRQKVWLCLLVCIRHGIVQEERKAVLLYEGVMHCGSSEATQSGTLSGSNGHGDLGYDEIESLQVGFEHRLLFSSGIEYAIRFRAFDFTIAAD